MKKNILVRYFYLLLSVILFFKFNTICNAQKYSTSFVDSIYNKAMMEKTDTNKIIFLLGESSKIYKKMPLEAKAITQKLHNIALGVPDKKWLAKSKSLLGTIEYFNGNYTESEAYFHEALAIYKKFNSVIGEAIVYNNIANIYRERNEILIAVEYYLKSIKIKEELRDDKGIVNTLNNIANLHLIQQNTVVAEQYYNQAKVIAEKIKDPESLAMTYSNLANIYFNAKEIEKSYQYDSLALHYRKKSGDKVGIAISLHNIASYFESKKDYKTALKYINESLNIKTEIGDKQGIAVSKTEKGTIYLNMHEPDSAIFYFMEALSIAQNLSIKKRMAVCYQNLAKAYSNKKDFNKAYEYERLYSDLKDEMTKEIHQKNISEMEAKYDTEKKKKEIELLTKETKLNTLLLRKKELERVNNKNEIELLNSINLLANVQNEKNMVEITRKKIELENTQKKVTLLHQKKQIQDLEIKNNQSKLKQQKIVLLFSVVGLIIVSFLAFFIFKGLKKQRNANTIISKQKLEVEKAHHHLEEKNKEITDSINYAKRIQEAILPSRYSLTENLNNGFVLFKPKDIVSGDFYWLEAPPPPEGGIWSSSPPPSGGQRGAIYFAAADCTGHGVPGAMVSVMCSNALSKSLLEENITIPGKILDRTRELVVQRFSKSSEDVKDGMDISLCSIKYKVGSEKLQTTAVLQWSGANNPLWIIRPVIASATKQSLKNDPLITRKDEAYELIEYKPNKQPIGKVDNPKPFTTHTIELQKGDTIYIFTDGFADQFGGPKGKKLMYKPFKELLLSIQDKTMDEQKEILAQHFEKWKGNLEQVDDVCVIGVRI